MITCAQIDSKQAYLVKIRNVWLFFSYNTLVCIRHNKEGNTCTIYETSEYHSRTTTTHIKDFYSSISFIRYEIEKVDNIEMLANQLLLESTKEMAVAYLTD